MKMKFFLTLPAVLILLSVSKIGFAAEPPYIPPILDQTAVVGELFTLDVNAELASPAETYELLEARPGMTIHPVSGLISWTPVNASDGGRVKVRAYNSAGESVRSFLIYLNEGVICDPNLKSYWPLDESTGPYNDVAGGHDATAQDVVSMVTGKVGNAQQFSPVSTSNKGLIVSSSTDFNIVRNGNFSIAMWIRWDGPAAGQNQVLVGRGDPDYAAHEPFYCLMVNENAFAPNVRLTWFLKPREANSEDDLIAAHCENFLTADEKWHHVAAVYSTSAGKIHLLCYLDGVAKTGFDYSIPATDFDGSFPLALAQLDYMNHFPFNGSMDEVQVYNRALTQSDVNQLMASGNSGQSACQPGNYYPLITSVPVTLVAQDELYSYTVTAHDYDNDAITLSADIVPEWATFNAGTGVLSGTPGSGDVGNHTVRLVVSDAGGSSTQTFTITVTDKNDPPVFTSTPVTTATENTAYLYAFLAEDPDGDNLTYSVGPGLASWLSFNASSKQLVGVPQRSNVGDHAVKIIASDGEFSVDQDFVITVYSNNHAPTITSTPATSVNKMSPYSYLIMATDADAGDVLTYSATLLPSWLTFNAGTHLLSGTPDYTQVGSFPVVLAVSDGYDETTQSFTIVVNNVNTAPVILSTPATTVRVNELYTYFVEVVDYEGDAVTLNGVIIPAWMTFDAGSRVLSGIPAASNFGTHTVIISVSDGVFVVPQQFSVTVQGPVGIEDASTLVNRVYPNPASDHVTFELTGKTSQVEIMDLSGKVLIQKTVSTGAAQIKVDVSTLNKGMYMFRVSDADVQQSGKLIIN
jgi:hypothetical protein